MSIFQYIADHEIPKDMPTPCNDLESFSKLKELLSGKDKASEKWNNLPEGLSKIANSRPTIKKAYEETQFDGLYAKELSNSKVVNANEETQLDRIEKKIDALNQKLDNIFGSNVLINGKFTQL